MIAADVFIDTNILIYAHDLEAGDRASLNSGTTS